MTLWNDVRLAVRLLLRDRAFSLAALVLGIAANATVFTILNGIFLRELPFAEPDRIVGIETRRTIGGNSDTDHVSYPDLLDLRVTAHLFDGIAGASQQTMSVSDESHGAERYQGAYLSENAFGLLGQRPLLGRDFVTDDDRPGADPVVILGHDIWQRWYGGETTVIGRVIRVNGLAATVVGVMPPEFGFPQVAQLWMPLAQSPEPGLQRRDARDIEAFARRPAAVTNQQAQADLDAVFEGLARLYPDTNSGTRAFVIPYRETMIGGPLIGVFSTLLGAVALLLLIACANVANLQLARGASRAREIALRLSLGASRAHIIRQMLVESLVLAVGAGLVGLLLGAAGARLFENGIVGADLPYFLQFGMEPRVIGFVAIVCVATAIAFGLAAALHASRVSLASVLNEGGRGSAGGLRTRRWAGALVVVQLTLAIVLLAGASALASNVIERILLDPGVDTGDIVVARFELPASAYATPEARRDFHERLDTRLAALPGIRATVAGWAPTAGGASMRVAVDGRPVTHVAEAQPRTTVVPVSARYFDTLRVNAIRGRVFTAEESRPGRLLAVVNAQFAATHFAGREPLGARIRLSPRRGPDAVEWLTVIGVVPNVRQEEADPRQVEAVVYTPYRDDPLSFSTIVARSDQVAGAVVATLRAEVGEIDRDLPLFGTGLLANVAREEEFALMRVIVSMLSTFAMVAVVLAAIGLYAVTAYAASRRTREIGVRVALGARAADIVWLVSRRATTQVGLGLLLGLAGAMGVGVVLEQIFETVNGHDPVIVGLVAVLMLLVVLAATRSPARRAVRLNPVEALRCE